MKVTSFIFKIKQKIHHSDFHKFLEVFFEFRDIKESFMAALGSCSWRTDGMEVYQQYLEY